MCVREVVGGVSRCSDPGCSDSTLPAPASLFHAAWHRCKGHTEPRHINKRFLDFFFSSSEFKEALKTDSDKMKSFRTKRLVMGG